jgi:flavorubredoxin
MITHLENCSSESLLRWSIFGVSSIMERAMKEELSKRGLDVDIFDFKCKTYLKELLEESVSP